MKQHIGYFFSKNIIEYIKVFMFFVIGFIISIIVINKSSDTQKKDLINYINDKMEIVRNMESVDKNEIFVESLGKNFKDFIILIFLASSIIGIPFGYYIIAKKGFSIGYTISAIAATQNVKTAIIFICSSMVIHNIMYMISIAIVFVSGVNFSKSVIKEKKENIKYKILRYLIFVLISAVIVIISSIIEAYISTDFIYFFKKYL